MVTPVVETIVLGAVSGVTEFLPVSSDGHLALAQILFDAGDAGLASTVVFHGGVLLATLLVLRRRVTAVLSAGIEGVLHPVATRGNPDASDALFVLLAAIPTAVLALLGGDAMERWVMSPFAVGVGFLITGGLLVSARFAPHGTISRPSAYAALLLGTAQGLAILPGVSRTCSTIVVALWLGIRPNRAFELSMLISVPALIAALLMQTRPATDPAALIAVLCGGVSAFAAGTVGVKWLERAVSRGLMPLFSLWVIPLGCACLALARAWPSPVH